MVPVELMPKTVELYLAGAAPRSPYASPLYGDPAGLPPTLIFVGSDAAPRDDAVRMAERLRAVDRDVELEVWSRMFHVWPMFARILPKGMQQSRASAISCELSYDGVVTKLGWGSIRSRFEILRKRSCNRFLLRNRVELMRVVSEGKPIRTRFRERHRLSVRAKIFR